MVSEQDCDVLAHTLWGEARGEGLADMVAVAWTIRNRGRRRQGQVVVGRRLRRRLPEALPVQLLEQDHPNSRFLRGARQIPFRELAQCRIAADQVIDGKVPDPTGALPTVTPVR